jgi:hypothetical protein
LVQYCPDRFRAEANKLAMLKMQKKGLMQQLFPDLQETFSPLPETGRGEKVSCGDRY